MAIVNIREGLLSMLEKVSGGGQLWIWRQEVVTDGYVGVVFIYLFIIIIIIIIFLYYLFLVIANGGVWLLMASVTSS